MNAVVTLSVSGSHTAEHALYSHPSFKAYAHKIGADFKVIDTRKYGNEPYTCYEKFQISHILNNYQRVLYIDTDTFIKPSCPDLFDIVPYSTIGGVYDCPENTHTSRQNFIWERISATQELYGYIGWKEGYINGGVYVVSDIHKAIFTKYSNSPMRPTWEQNTFNYNIVKNGFDIFKLDRAYNTMGFEHIDTWTPRDIDGSYIIHYAGRGNASKQLQFLYNKYKSDLQC